MVENLHEIIAFILKEIDGNGNPDLAQKEFGISNDKYREIVDVADLDGYITGGKKDMSKSIIPETSAITQKGYALIRKYYNVS